MKTFLTLLFAIARGIVVFAQPNNEHDKTNAYTVGYKNLITIDSGRQYKPNTSVTDKLHFRPIEIDIWYPSLKTDTKSPIKYGAFLQMLEQRSNRFQDDTVYHALTSELVQYLAGNLNIGDASKITNLPTASYENAVPLQQPFPLILYMSSFNGMGYENIQLFEWLASHGYVVACMTSVGSYPGNMSTRFEDLMEQVNDGLFAIKYLASRKDIDSTKIGAMGYSWGGIAAALLSMNDPHVKALLSLDGSEIHYYGESKQEDEDFDAMRHSTFFRPHELKVPYYYLESSFKQTDRDADSIFNMLPSLWTQKQYFRFSKATHEDFSFLPSLVARTSGKNDEAADLHRQFGDFSLNYFDRYLKEQPAGLSAQVVSILNHHAGDSSYPKQLVKKDLISINGRILDEKNNEPIPYVNVGVPDRNIGTVTSQDGKFLIRVNPEFLGDSLKISMAGYESQTVSLTKFSQQTKPAEIFLKQRMTELKEVTITAKPMPSKTRGNTTTSNFVSVGLPLKFLGSETGIRINLGKDPVLIKEFSFNISENRLDTAVFRLNIYNFKKGNPQENILTQNILVPIGKQKGKYLLNLSPYKLVLQGDVLISLEWIEGSSSGKQSGAIFLSAAFLNSATWHRLTSQAAWKKAPGMGVGFNIVVQKLKN